MSEPSSIEREVTAADADSQRFRGSHGSAGGVWQIAGKQIGAEAAPIVYNVEQ
jgi:hypothetical protein